MKHLTFLVIIFVLVLQNQDGLSQINLFVDSGLQVNSITNPGRDYTILCSGRQNIFAENDLVTDAKGNMEFRPATGGDGNRGFIITDGNQNKFFFAHSGSQSIGIGNDGLPPRSKLHVRGGDTFIEDVGSGVIIKSPDGNCWRLTPDNSGNSVWTSITCP